MSSSPESFDPYYHWLGIDPAARPVHHYSLLGLSLFEADAARIATAADERMKLIRQYQAGPRGAFTQKILNELAKAKICLLNPVSKPAYDQALHQLLYPPSPMPSATAAPPKPKRKLEDIMPPGWDGSLAAPAESLPLPSPIAPPPRAVVSQSWEASSEENTSLPTPLRKQSLNAVLVLGGLIVVVGILGIFFALRMLNPAVPRPDPAGLVVQVPEETDPTSQPPPPKDPSPKVPPNEAELPQAIVVLQEGSGEVNLTPATALVEGKLEREVQGAGEVLVHWSSPADVAEWQFKLVKPGFFELELQYVSHPGLAGKQAKVDWGTARKAFSLRAPPGEEGVVRDSHFIVIKKGGEHTLSIRPAETWPADAFRLVSIRLIPAVGP